MNDLNSLAHDLDNCASCPLRKDCIAPVGWFGDSHSPLVIVGEGPGGVEDEYGCPLIGPSGQLLDKALWSVKITREHILTTNVIKCRPKGNRTPTPEEAKICADKWLTQELAIIQPKAIIALGGVALKYFRGPQARITQERGKWFRTPQGYDAIATFHPSYLLRLTGKAQIAAKWDVFHDLQAARARVLETVPDYHFCSDQPYPLFRHFTKRN